MTAVCIEFDSFRIQSFSHAMAQVRELVGLASIWDRDLQHVAAVRALAVAGQLDRLECLLMAARFHAGHAGFDQAARLVGGKLAEVGQLAAEVRRLDQNCAAFDPPCVDVIVLDSDWGKKGRGQKILAWIAATGADAAAVAERFQLALSTSKTYCRRARKAAGAKIAA